MQLTVAVKVCEVSIVGCFRCQQLLSVEYMVTSSGHLTAVALCFVQACRFTFHNQTAFLAAVAR